MTPTFRPATAADAADLAILFDAASRRIVSWFWSRVARPGQSWFEVGRDRIRNDMQSDSHFSRWQIAMAGSETAGALCSLRLADPYGAGDPASIPDPARPFIELEAVAAGTYYLFVASVFPEHRGKGLGQYILAKAAELGRAAGARQLTLIVESFNPGARRLYLRSGFRDWASRPFIAFPGGDDTSGELILMVRDLD